MEKLIPIFKYETLSNNKYYYEIEFDNLELRGLVSIASEVEIKDISTLQSLKSTLLVDNSKILYQNLKESFPEIAKNYEL